MTATEAALYNMQTGGKLINKMEPLSHKNLPLAMFLEKDDLGYTVWIGSKNSYVTDSDIIQYPRVGIVSFKEPEEEVEVTLERLRIPRRHGRIHEHYRNRRRA